MSAALAEAPQLAWFVPVAPGRPTGRPDRRRPASLRLSPVPPLPAPGRAPAALLVPDAPAPVRAPATPARRPRPVAVPTSVRLRLTARGARVVALAVLAGTLVGGFARADLSARSTAIPAVSGVARGLPLTVLPGAAVVGVTR